MVDLMSIAVGLIIGVGIGYIAGRLSSLRDRDMLVAEYERLMRDYRKISTRDERGRFVGSKKK
jgi:uncharacterized membrane-anchored protein YhcB (DUF1043 family)